MIGGKGRLHGTVLQSISVTFGRRRKGPIKKKLNTIPKIMNRNFEEALARLLGLPGVSGEERNVSIGVIYWD